MSQADMNQDKRAGSPLIEVSHVSKCFGEHQVLTDVTADFNAGEVAVIVGASGSGKSTFLRMLNRLERHDAGRIVIDGIEVDDDRQRLEALRKEVGMVFQQFNLFSHLSVWTTSRWRRAACASSRLARFASRVLVAFSGAMSNAV